MVQEEGLENAWDRHQRNHEYLRDGLQTMGIDFVVAESIDSPQLNAVAIPQGVDDMQIEPNYSTTITLRLVLV